MDMITLTVDGRKVEVPKGSTVLDAARAAGIDVPTLCYLKDVNAVGVCRVCVVEIDGAKSLQASCVTPAGEGMSVHTNTPAVREARRMVLELILSNHPFECLTCERNGNCELQALADRFGIRDIEYQGERAQFKVDASTPSIVRDPNKCILCRRCMSVCQKVQTVCALAPNDRGFGTMIAPAFGDELMNAVCALCGQCVLVCPTGALKERDETEAVWAAIADPSKHVVVQTAPAIRASIGEECGLGPGSRVTGQLTAALRRLGFDMVFDTDFTADLTIMEEGHEFIARLRNGGKLPLITSCSPGWIKFVEHFYPDLLPNLSTCKSPQQMFGALAKTYYARKSGIDPKDIFVVSVMPCTAKKFEARRPEMTASGYPDVDAVLTTRELGRMIREAGIDFESLAPEPYDPPLGISTGAGAIFGVTGGVMEAALRTVSEVVLDRELDNIDFVPVRGLAGVKEAEVNLDGTSVRVAVAHGLGNARRLLDRVSNGEADYHFIEIMACPGGCIGGGGQPIPTNDETRMKRIAAIYEEDKHMPLRKSHLNPAVQELYREFLGRPLGERSHELLHTHYHARARF
ncbi:MAG: NADH-dependent [FeFe] hydrogenase, group A6 [Firmicutes bacterium]|jgi:NADH-quinone oxidoreductase subunit G/NADP-reducing hydrogenase subunit HndD|nr:NADH-dependent [FeFe] hydrogenase, group A6 [Bacillota bacterium]MDH7494877.1 NADH-dependent [FeFe] hydrogenase, group A6 [Bacillota bacterium]